MRGGSDGRRSIRVAGRRGRVPGRARHRSAGPQELFVTSDLSLRAVAVRVQHLGGRSSGRALHMCFVALLGRRVLRGCQPDSDALRALGPVTGIPGANSCVVPPSRERLRGHQLGRRLVTRSVPNAWLMPLAGLRGGVESNRG